MTKQNDPQVGPDKEFPTEWHRDAFLEGLEREVLGAQRRVEELSDLDAHSDTVAAAEEQVANARAELKRLGHGQEAASKRPRAAVGKQSRSKRPAGKKAQKDAAKPEPAEKAEPEQKA